MTLFKWELRKIWRPGILAAMLLLGVVYYWMFPEFYIEYFCNGPDAEAQFQLASEWVAQYGPTLEPEERAELDGQLAEELETFNEQIAAIPEAAAAGLTDYRTFCAFRDDYYTDTAASGGDADMDLESLVQRVYSGTNWYIIEEIQNTMDLYDAHEKDRTMEIPNREAMGQPEAMVRRADQLTVPESAHSLLPFPVKESTREYGKDLVVWCVLSIVLLLSPTLVRDRLRRTRAMQWTSRRGRSILTTQMAAALCSALVLTVVNLVIYAIPFLAQGPLQFHACGLDGIWAWGTPWFDWTYGTYLIVLAGMILALSLAAAGFTVFLSQYSSSYIAMLLKALPLFVAVGAVLGSWLLNQPFCFRRFWETGPWMPKGTETAVIVILVSVSVLLCALTCRRQRKRELL
ncbi:hypothetical protein [uncultured Oscillibacter sp.]|uniref:hypothetical protein n=1 Tax=uncultured Oscillibacter sp. TaxID=876091 RepID=UPI0025E5DF2B|nr:hypothetical protein [uncultured Oscillibacter sp.]